MGKSQIPEKLKEGIILGPFKQGIVLYISDACCTEFNIYYFILYLFSVINDSIFNLMMLIQSVVLLKNHVSCNLC